MELTPEQKNKRKEWNVENQDKLYDSIRLVVKKGNKDILKAVAKQKNVSVNRYINDLIYEDCKEHGYQMLDEQGKNTKKSSGA